MRTQPDLSATKYQQFRHLLAPKHLELPPSKHKQQFRDKFLLQPPVVGINENKMKFLRPIKQIQTIMQHFNAKFQNGKPKQQSLKKGASHRQRANSSVGSTIISPIDKKMSELLNLPTLKVIKKRAESYRNALNAEQINERNDRKEKIMMQFNAYMKAQLKGSNSLIRQRINTVT